MSEEPQELPSLQMVRLRSQRKVLVDYLYAKAEQGDWHGVADAANDLRVLEMQMQERAERRGQ